MGDGNVVMHVRFRVTNIAAGVTGSALLEALTSQLALDDVALVWGSLKKVEDGTQEAEFDLPNEEAELLRGPMSQAKVHIGGPMIVRFSELFEEDVASVGPSASGIQINAANGFGGVLGAHQTPAAAFAALSYQPDPLSHQASPGAPLAAPRGWRDLVADPSRVPSNGLLAQSQQPMYATGRPPVDPYLGEPYPREPSGYLSARSTSRDGYSTPTSARHYITRPVKNSSCCSRWVSPREEQEAAYSARDGDPYSARDRDQRDEDEQGGCVMQ